MKDRLASAALKFSLVVLVAAVPALAQGPQASGAPTSDDAVPPITVQIAPPPLSISGAYGVSSPMGAQPAAGKPLVAQFVTEHHQSFSDGTHIARTTQSSVYRDAAGRLRRESQLALPGLPAAVSTASFVNLVDRQQGFGYVLDPQEMVAHRYPLDGPAPSYVARVNAKGSGNALLGTPQNSPAPPQESRWHLLGLARHFGRGSSGAPALPDASKAGEPQAVTGFISDETVLTAAPSMRIDQPFLAAPYPVRTENLGEKEILGYRCTGSRVITTLPAGQIGNDRPIDIVSEQWFAPELELVMRSLHRDPWAGEFITSVTKVTRGEQPSALFDIPEHYKVVDAASEREHHVLDGHDH